MKFILKLLSKVCTVIMNALAILFMIQFIDDSIQKLYKERHTIKGRVKRWIRTIKGLKHRIKSIHRPSKRAADLYLKIVFEAGMEDGYYVREARHALSQDDIQKLESIYKQIMQIKNRY